MFWYFGIGIGHGPGYIIVTKSIEFVNDILD